MLKRFLKGAVFGAGFAAALLVVQTAGFVILLPALSGRIIIPKPEEIGIPPDIGHEKRFLGTTGTYNGEFSHDGDRVLSEGPGRIAGSATADGEPVEGLRLRLALNGSVMSQWATTGADGRYEIAVPYGEYRIDGYELDRRTADATLPGRIGHPQNVFWSNDTFDVSNGAPGHGLTFRFVEPVVLDMPKTRYSTDEAVVIRWKPYSGANQYQVQIYEKTDPNAFDGRDTVFPRSDMPVVNKPAMNLGDYDIELKPGHFYRVAVEARADNWQVLSQTVDRYRGFDFEVVDQ